MISLVIITLLVYARSDQHGHFRSRITIHSFVIAGNDPDDAPAASFASPWAFASKIVAGWLAPLGVGSTPCSKPSFCCSTSR